MPRRVLPNVPIADTVRLERYGYITKTAVLRTKCGCTKQIEIDVDRRGPPPVLGIPLEPVADTGWWRDERDLMASQNERIFKRVGDRENPYHYEEQGDARVAGPVLTPGKTRQIFLPDEDAP